MADIHFTYGLLNGAGKARCIYHERYPHRELPCSAISFSSIHRRLCEIGLFEKRKNVPGRSTTVRTPALEKAVLHKIEENPETSTRKITRALNVSHPTILSILHDQQLYSYHIQRVQALLPRDFPQRLVFVVGC